MSYDSSGVYTRASNTTATAGQAITATMHETEWEDLKTALNKLPVKDVANTMTASQKITVTDAGALSSSMTFTLYRNSSSPAAADGLSAIYFDGNNGSAAEVTYCAIVGLISDTTAASEDGVLSLRAMRAGTLTAVMNIGDGVYYQGGTDKGTNTANFNGVYSQASVYSHNGTAIPAGGTAGAGLLVSSTSNFGVFFGSGAPSLSAAKGSLYLRSDGSTTSNRMYVNTDGGTTWTAVTTAA